MLAWVVGTSPSGLLINTTSGNSISECIKVVRAPARLSAELVIIMMERSGDTAYWCGHRRTMLLITVGNAYIRLIVMNEMNGDAFASSRPRGPSGLLVINRNDGQLAGHALTYEGPSQANAPPGSLSDNFL